MSKLVIVRHGQSEWNLENKFTGWVDVELTPKGVEEGKAAGVLLKKEGYQFDQAFSSVLKRANNTLGFILDGIDQKDIQTCALELQWVRWDKRAHSHQGSGSTSIFYLAIPRTLRIVQLDRHRFECH